MMKATRITSMIITCLILLQIQKGKNLFAQQLKMVITEEKRGKLNKRRIQLVVYKWDDVLCTKPDKYSKSTEATTDLLTKAQIELLFGSDRICI